jgi:hypothetical protein
MFRSFALFALALLAPLCALASSMGNATHGGGVMPAPHAPHPAKAVNVNVEIGNHVAGHNVIVAPQFVRNVNYNVWVQFSKNEINYYNHGDKYYIAKFCHTCPLVFVRKQCDCYFEPGKNKTMAIPPPTATSSKDMVHYGHPTVMHPAHPTGEPFIFCHATRKGSSSISSESFARD